MKYEMWRSWKINIFFLGHYCRVRGIFFSFKAISHNMPRKQQSTLKLTDFAVVLVPDNLS